MAVVFAVAGAAAAHLAAARTNHRRSRSRQWYDERKAAYVQLLTGFERATYRLRAAYEAGEKPPTALTYMDEIGPALMPVRLLSSGSVRSAALAVHLQLQRLHGEMNPAGVVGVEPRTHFRELLAQVPLVMQQFEAAIRDELEIDDTPPAEEPASTGLRRRPAGAGDPATGGREPEHG